jgi:hypothetical protein
MIVVDSSSEAEAAVDEMIHSFIFDFFKTIKLLDDKR